MRVIEQKQKLADMFAGDDNGMELNIKIGREEEQNLPDGCSLVTAKIGINKNSYGNIGVIGPVRMDYKKVVKTLKNLTGELDEIFNKKY